MNLLVFFASLITLKSVAIFFERLMPKKLENKNGYFGIHGSLSYLPLTLTFIASLLGGGLVLGSAEEAYKFGWYFLFYPLGISLGMLCLGVGIGTKLYGLGISTVAQVFEVIYGSIFLKRVASLISIFSLFLILLAQIIAAKKFLFALGINNTFVFFGCWLVILIYTSWGGFKTVITTHFVQTIFFMISLLIAFFYFINTIPQETQSLLSEKLQHRSLPNFMQVIGWLFNPIFFLLIAQDMAQRCFAARSTKTVTQATITAGIGLLIFSCIPLFLGDAAFTSQHVPLKGASVLMSILIAKTTPLIAGLVGAGLIAAIVSSAESLINAISSNIYNDFNLENYFGHVYSSKSTAFIVGVIALCFSWLYDNVIGFIIVSYELSIACLFVPIFIAFVKQKGNRLSALYSVIAGALSLMIFYYTYAHPPPAYQLICLLISLLFFYVGEAQTYWIKLRKNT